jgi:hypothetical protein
MLRPVDFDHQTPLSACEVGEVAAYGFLAAPLPIEDLAVAQATPEMKLGLC